MNSKQRKRIEQNRTKPEERRRSTLVDAVARPGTTPDEERGIMAFLQVFLPWLGPMSFMSVPCYYEERPCLLILDKELDNAPVGLCAFLEGPRVMGVTYFQGGERLQREYLQLRSIHTGLDENAGLYEEAL